MVKNPLVIKEHVCPVESTRKQFMEETSQNIKGSKKFSFKKYLTEKERLKQYYAQEKHVIDVYEDKGKTNAKKVPDKKRKRTHTVIYQQPRMRFKPRTEFERIVDTINDYNYGKVNNDLIKKQLKNMELALMKKKLLKEKRNELSDSQSDSDSSNDNANNANVKGNKHETSTERTSHNQSKQSFYKNKGSSRILVDNSVAKKLMEEYHYKTHFKAAAQLADKYSADVVRQKREELLKTKVRLLNNVNARPSRRTQSCIKLRNKTFYKDVASKEMSKQMSDSVLTQFASKFPLREENFDLVQANPLLYNLNFHSFKSSSDLSNQQQSNEYSMEEKLNYLKNLSFNYSVNEEESVSKKKVTFAENIDKKKDKAAKKLHSLISTEDDDNVHIDFSKDDKIWVNDEAISLGQMDLIALKILRNCNYFHKKNMNNNTSLKKGDGKLMITSGMTVNEFTKKYKLN